ncbi:MAG: hypothetical protein LUE23_11855, partial [Lachnospiraceae bacterium]|nr:hypothetical protein [Lachnospiraceae bacterium]
MDREADEVTGESFGRDVVRRLTCPGQSDKIVCESGELAKQQGVGQMQEMGTGLEKTYVERNNRRMAYGYTTGSCAAAGPPGGGGGGRGGKSPAGMGMSTPRGQRRQRRAGRGRRD